MQFSDGSSDMELRLELGDRDIQSTKDILVDANESFLTVRLQCSGFPKTLIETSLYDKIKPAETIWYVSQSCKFTSHHQLSHILLTQVSLPGTWMIPSWSLT